MVHLAEVIVKSKCLGSFGRSDYEVSMFRSILVEVIMKSKCLGLFGRSDYEV